MCAKDAGFRGERSNWEGDARKGKARRKFTLRKNCKKEQASRRESEGRQAKHIVRKQKQKGVQQQNTDGGK